MTTPRASGKWTSSQETVSFVGLPYTVRTYTFRAESGFTAVMKKEMNGPRKETYTARITDPAGRPAEYVSEDGRHITGMELHLNLREAKLTVEENVHRADRLAEELAKKPA